MIRNLTHESMTDFVIAESPYSASKIAGEAFVSSFARCYRSTRWSSASPTSMAATTTTSHRMERVIPLFVRNIWEEKPITVFGRDKMLDFTYIDDCIAGIAAGIDALLSEPAGPHVSATNHQPRLR